MSDLLVMYRGDTFTFTQSVVDAAGEPIDLTGAMVTFTVKRKFNDLLPFIQYDTLDGVTVDDSDVTVTIQPTDTAMLTGTERFVWDIEVIYGSGDEVTYTPMVGRLVVRMDSRLTRGSGS
jgi:hypothetical protein